MTRLSLVSMVAGLALLVGAPVAWQLGQPEDTVGGLETVAPVTTQRSADDVPRPPRDTQTPELEAEPLSPPSRLRVPSIGVDAPVDPVGLEDDGGMEIPHDIRRIGWYEPGVEVGDEKGTAVLSGHVDSREQGHGAFWDLRETQVDDIVTVEHEDGTASEWRVVARTVYPKDELPIADIFTRFGDPGLVLITCGGAFDNTTRQYEENVVVYTEPVADQDRAST